VTEEWKAKDVSKKLGTEIHGHQIILSHTPMKRLAQTYKKDNVLIVGMLVSF